jgi:hypothetical protein
MMGDCLLGGTWLAVSLSVVPLYRNYACAHEFE